MAINIKSRLCRGKIDKVHLACAAAHIALVSLKTYSGGQCYATTQFRDGFYYFLLTPWQVG